MKVLPINNNYMQYKSVAVQQKRTAQAVSAPSFKALWGKPDSQELFDYGIQALDGTSLFIVTKDKESAELSLQRHKDKIDIPVMKTYILNITKDLDKKWYESSNSDVAIFKKGEDYYAMPLGTLSVICMHERGKDSTKEDYISAGNLKKLTSGMVLGVREWEIGGRDRGDVDFNRPKTVDNSKAERYLEVKTYMDSVEKIRAHNNAAIVSMLKPKTQKTGSNKKEFTFADVGGLDNIIQDLRKFVIRPLNYPQVFEKFGIRLNIGILLYGPPRCGKTLIGQALANEAGIDFKYCNANEFKHPHVGESEGLVRTAFDKLMAKPSILFIDEIDAIAKERDGSSTARHDDSLANQLLGSMSDLEKTNITSFIIGATNKRELLDKAFLASGRFGLQLEVPMPNEEALGQIYDIHSKNQVFAEDVNKPEIVKMMFENTFNGSDVAEMISVGFFNALERLGMNAKMDAGTFSFEDMKSIKVAKEDLILAIKNISKQKIKG